MEREPTTAKQVADYFIVFSHEVGDPLSNLKLQKLLYYAQAWFLALYDKPLFSERIEAWVHGPAVPPVYGQFKEWAWQPIMCTPATPTFPKLVDEHLTEVMEQYGRFNAYQLELLTHSEKPWRDARNGIPPDEPSNAVIPHEAMRDFYRSLLNEQTVQEVST
jgi:uncharacterized phage-associated protein